MAISKPDLSLIIRAQIDKASLENVNRDVLTVLNERIVQRLSTLSTANIGAARTQITSELTNLAKEYRGLEPVINVLQDTYAGLAGTGKKSFEELRTITMGLTKEVTHGFEERLKLQDETHRAFVADKQQELATTKSIVDKEIQVHREGLHAILDTERSINTEIHKVRIKQQQDRISDEKKAASINLANQVNAQQDEIRTTQILNNEIRKVRLNAPQHRISH